METTNLIILMVYTLVVFTLFVGLFVLDTAHSRSEKESAMQV